jgi:hypothetical protein
MPVGRGYFTAGPIYKAWNDLAELKGVATRDEAIAKGISARDYVNVVGERRAADLMLEDRAYAELPAEDRDYVRSTLSRGEDNPGVLSWLPHAQQQALEAEVKQAFAGLTNTAAVQRAARGDVLLVNDNSETKVNERVANMTATGTGLERPAPSPAAARRGVQEQRLTGTVERIDLTPAKGNSSEFWSTRLKVVTPGREAFTTNDGRNIPERAPKVHYHSAILRGEAELVAPSISVGDSITVHGALDAYRGQKGSVLSTTAFRVTEPTQQELMRPNEAHVLGEIVRSSFRPSYGNDELNSVDFTVRTPGRNSQDIAVREFSPEAQDRAKSTLALGEKVELTGKLTVASWGPEGAKKQSYYIATTPKEVENMRERAAERSHERDQERAQAIEETLATNGQGNGLDAPTREALEAERAFLLASPAERAEMHERAAAAAQDVQAGGTRTAAEEAAIAETIATEQAATRANEVRTALEQAVKEAQQGLSADVVADNMEEGLGAHPALRGFANVAASQVNDAGMDPEQYGASMQQYVRATTELVTSEPVTTLTEEQRAGVIASIRENAVELSVAPKALVGLSDDALLGEYLTSGAAIEDRAKEIGARDALEQQHDRGHEQERETGIAEDADIPDDAASSGVGLEV